MKEKNKQTLRPYQKVVRFNYIVFIIANLRDILLYNLERTAPSAR